MKKLLYIFGFIISISCVYAAGNYIKTGENWDANVDSNELANDVIQLSGRLDIEDSLSYEYSQGYRGSISNAEVFSPLFGDFTFDNTIELHVDDSSTVPANCGTSREFFSFTGMLDSPYWGAMRVVESDSYYCSNSDIYIQLESDNIGYKDIGGISGGKGVFGKQKIFISGVTKLIGNTKDNILFEGGIENDILFLETGKQYKKEVSKQISIQEESIFSTYYNSDENKALSSSTLVDNFSNNGEEEVYYLYDYEGDIGSNIGFLSKTYPNKAKTLQIGNTGDGKIAITGKNTIIVKGGNIYINSNLYNTNDASSLLVIRAKKGEDGRGGNIYVSPDVTNIDAVIIAEGSMMSYESGKILSVEVDNNYNRLRKQLYIYGSLLSSNVIGSDTIPFGSDYYEHGDYSSGTMEGNIYDLANIRTFNLNYGSAGGKCDNEFKLAPIDGNGDYVEYGWAGKKLCYSDNVGDSDLRVIDKKNPLIIDYNPAVPQLGLKILSNN